MNKQGLRGDTVGRLGAIEGGPLVPSEQRHMMREGSGVGGSHVTDTTN